MGLIVSEHSKPRQRWLSFLRPLSRTRNTLGRRTLLLTVVLSVAFALLVKKFRRGDITSAIWLGVMAGAAIFISYAIAYGLTDGLFRR